MYFAFWHMGMPKQTMVRTCSKNYLSTGLPVSRESKQMGFSHGSELLVFDCEGRVSIRIVPILTANG
ncbi:MAG: hypothetical protein EBT92_16515 [Planctomycetes bacterium]|nr:hypothetical protein [Planctomycetota bacterium]NBY01661.1 hypothetical protein [Planctomycetota bacterium]